jgi:hypothetical protein
MVRRWIKCGKCGKEYDINEYLRLRTIPVNPNDLDPRLGSGYTKICECGYVFGKDKWMKKTTVKLKECEIEVSTVFLEVNHGSDEKPLWYETMIFPGTGLITCWQQWRYETREEAEKGHERIVELLKAGKYRIVPIQYEMIVVEGD